MADKKGKTKRAAAQRGSAAGLLEEYGLMIVLVFVMGLGLALVLWAVFGLSLLIALGAGLAFALAGSVVMWFAG